MSTHEGKNAEIGNCGGLEGGCDGNGGSRGSLIYMNKRNVGSGGAGYITNGESVICDLDTCSDDIYAEGGYAYVNGNMGGSVSIVQDSKKVRSLGEFGGGGMGKFSQ